MPTERSTPATPAADTLDGRTNHGRAATHPLRIPPRGWLDIAVRVRGEWRPDHVALSAAGVAFFAFIAFVPAIAALVSVLGLVARKRATDEVITDLFGPLPESVQELLTDQLASISASSSRSLSIGLVVSLVLSFWSASTAVGYLLTAINVAYDEEDHRPWYVKRAIAMAITLGAVAFMAVAVLTVVVVPSLISRTGLDVDTQRWLGLAIWPALAVAFGFGLGILYRVAPDRRSPRWRWVSVGSVVAVLAWIVLTVGFRLYVANFASYNETYGSLSAVVVLLLWLWGTAVMVLIGAEVNAEAEYQTTVDTTVGDSRPIGERGAVKADGLGPLHVKRASRRRARHGGRASTRSRR